MWDTFPSMLQGLSYLFFLFIRQIFECLICANSVLGAMYRKLWQKHNLQWYFFSTGLNRTLIDSWTFNVLMIRRTTKQARWKVYWNLFHTGCSREAVSQKVIFVERSDRNAEKTASNIREEHFWQREQSAHVPGGGSAQLVCGAPRRPVWCGRSCRVRGRKQGRVLPRISEGAWPYQHLDFRLLSSWTMRQYISVLFSHLVCGTWLQQS